MGVLVHSKIKWHVFMAHAVADCRRYTAVHVTCVAGQRLQYLQFAGFFRQHRRKVFYLL